MCCGNVLLTVVVDGYLKQHTWHCTLYIYILQPNYCHGEQQDAGKFLTGVLANMHDLLFFAKRLYFSSATYCVDINSEYYVTGRQTLWMDNN